MKWIRRSIAVVFAAAVIGVLIYAVLPKPVPVDLAEVVRGRFVQTVDDDGKTRVRERYTVSAPLAGTLLRIRLKAGDPVAIGSRLAAIVPNPSPLIDPRTRQELEQRLGAAQGRKQRAAAAVDRAHAALDQATADLKRTRVLAERGVASQSTLDRDRIAERIAARELDMARFEDRASAYEVEQARAALAMANTDEEGPTPGETWDIHSPVAGRVLRVMQESEASVAIGTPLIEIGDVRDLEIVVDVLSADAVKIRPGAPAEIERWGGGRPLAGRVRRVEPSAFTKVSALGVEEQRTNVVIDITSPRSEWSGLGDGYRIDARIVIYEADDVVKVPTGALFREGDRWAVYVASRAVARKRIVKLSRRTGLEAAVESGVKPGDEVILFPGDVIRDGTRVRRR